MWDRIRAAWRRFSVSSRQDAPVQSAGRPNAPTLAEMRTLLRAGMTRDEFFTVLDEIVVERGLRLRLPTNSDTLVALPVAEGGELLCFLPTGVLNYVEYKGDIFLEKEDEG